MPRNSTINWITKFIKRFTFSGPHPGKGPRLWVSRGKELSALCFHIAPSPWCCGVPPRAGHPKSLPELAGGRTGKGKEELGWDRWRWRQIPRMEGSLNQNLTFRLFLVTTPFSLLPFPFSVVVGLDYRQFRVGTLLRVAVPSLETPHLVGVCRLYINIITAIRIKLERDPIFTSSPSHS